MEWKEAWKQIWKTDKKLEWVPDKKLAWKEAWKQIWVPAWKEIWVPAWKKIWKPVWISEWFPIDDHHPHHGWDRKDTQASDSQIAPYSPDAISKQNAQSQQQQYQIDENKIRWDRSSKTETPSISQDLVPPPAKNQSGLAQNFTFPQR